MDPGIRHNNPMELTWSIKFFLNMEEVVANEMAWNCGAQQWF